jgi:hypothetical protein
VQGDFEGLGGIVKWLRQGMFRRFLSVVTADKESHSYEVSRMNSQMRVLIAGGGIVSWLFDYHIDWNEPLVAAA